MLEVVDDAVLSPTNVHGDDNGGEKEEEARRRGRRWWWRSRRRRKRDVIVTITREEDDNGSARAATIATWTTATINGRKRKTERMINHPTGRYAELLVLRAYL